MKQCQVCGNEYENAFEIRFENDGRSHWFDCFECASHELAPECSYCGVKILGHGMQAGSQLFCGTHCARSSGFRDLTDYTKKSGKKRPQKRALAQ